MSEPDQIVIPKSWAEFRERFLAWYHARRAYEVNCSIYLFLLGAFIVFMICISFPDSTTAKLINAVNGILASCAVALISINHIVKREDRYGRKDNCFFLLWDGTLWIIVGFTGLVFWSWTLIRLISELVR